MSLAVTLFVFICAVIGALFGLNRGFKRSIVTLIGAIVSAVLAFFLAVPVSKLIITPQMIETVLQNLGALEIYNELISASSSLKEIVIMLPAAIIAPIIFLLLFAIIKLLMKIPCGIISLSLGSKSHNRVLGVPLGAVQGLVSAFVIVVVITGFISVADNITTAVLADTSDSTVQLRESFDDINSALADVKKDPVVKLMCPESDESEKSHQKTSVNKVFNSLTSFKLNDEKVSTSDELVKVTDTAVSVTPLLSNKNISQWSDEEIIAIEHFSNNFQNSAILIQVSPELIAQMSDNWSRGESFLGIEPPSVDKTIDPLLNSLYGSLRVTTSETLKEDLSDFIEILKIFNKYGIFEKLSNDGSNILIALDGEFITELLGLLNENERFCVIVPEVTNMSLRILATTLKLPENNTEIYHNVTNDIAVSITNVLSSGATQESVEQLSIATRESLKNNGIEISAEASAIVSDALLKKFNNSDNASAAEIQSFFEDFAIIYDAVNAAGSEQMNSGELGYANLSNSSKDEMLNYDFDNMSYDEKLAFLSAIGLYDHYNSQHDLSNADHTLDNGKKAEEFVDYILYVYSIINANYDSLNNENGEALNGLRSPETILTTKVTAEDLLINTDVKFTEDDIKEFGNSFNAITAFIDSYSSIEGDISMDNLHEIDIASAGKALDSLKNISALSDSVDKISNAVVSEIVGTNTNITDKMNANNTSFEEIFITVGSTSQVISNISDKEKSEEEKEAAILDLLLNLTPGTADVVNEVITEDLVKQYGVYEAQAPASVKALRAAFIEMANLTGEEHDSEAQHIIRLIELTTLIRNSDTESIIIIGPDGLFESETHLINMAIHSKVAVASLKSITIDEIGAPIYDALNLSGMLTEESKSIIASELNNIYTESINSMSDEELNNLINNIYSVSYLLNIEITFIA